MAELDSQPKNLQSLYREYAEAKLHVNRRYQRKLVWTLAEKQKLISSVLKGYPIPAVLLAERDGYYEIIDGLQRLHTLMSFIEAAFSTEDGQYFRVEEFPSARQRRDAGIFSKKEDASEISPSEVGKFLDYPLSISIMRKANDDEIEEVFSRINTFGHRLSDQERRQAGVQSDFATLVRRAASEIRGDSSPDTLTLGEMPQISIDLPKMKHGYGVTADSVLWVEQGILSAGNLRDSLDEQCIADAMACIVGGTIIERSKDALDRIYSAEDQESTRIARALDSYGSEKALAEFKFCVDEITRAVKSTPGASLGSLLGVTNPFPAVFTILVIAFHEALVQGQKHIADTAAVRDVFSGLYRRLNTDRSSTVPTERRKNIDIIKGMIASSLGDTMGVNIYANASSIDVENIIRRSNVEVARYEVKQGAHGLSGDRAWSDALVAKVINTIVAIANCGPDADGVIIIGVADKEADARRIESLDGISPKKVGDKYVVGVAREARLTNSTDASYVGRWKTAIRESELCESLKMAVLGAMDYNQYYGLGVVVIRVPRQSQPSLVGNRMFIRQGDETVEVTEPRDIMLLTNMFQGPRVNDGANE